MNCEISTELQLGLSKLCRELQLFSNRTESSLFLAQEKFKQVNNVMKPWEVSDSFDSEQGHCICKTLSNIQISENFEESALLNTISKTLNNAELIRRKSLKTETNSNDNNLRRPSESIIKNKPKIHRTVKKCTSVQSTSANNSKHSPCCPLFKTSHELTTKQSFLKLSDAIIFHKIPSVLSRSIRHSTKILYTEKSESSIKCNYKDIFFKNLEAQNEKYCTLYQEKDSSIGTFLTYLSALNSYEKKRKNINCNTWFFYKNVQNLETFHTSRFHIITKESWIIILKFITNDFIPGLQESALDRKQKLYLFKILKTICNFVYSNIPSVPIFRVK